MLRSRLPIPGRTAVRPAVPTDHAVPTAPALRPAPAGRPSRPDVPAVREAPGADSRPRAKHSSRDALEARLARLEGGRHAIAFADPDSARSALADALAHSGAAAHHTTTLEGPELTLLDVRAAADAAHRRGRLLVVDNTLTPAELRPLAHGAGIVLHSALDILGGHGDSAGAVLIASDPVLAGHLRTARAAMAGALDAFSAWLVILGLDTLSVRAKRSAASARAIAAALARDRRVGTVHDPGLGSTLAVEFRNAEAAAGFARSTRLFARSAKIGGVASLIPVVDHRADRSIVRLAVGIEDARDLQADLLAALDRSAALLHAQARRA